jgi:putative redox protein
MYAERKQFALHGVAVRLSHNRVQAKDCRDCETKAGMVDEITSEIHLAGDLDDAQRKRLLQVATRCPIHRALSNETKIRTSEV